MANMDDLTCETPLMPTLSPQNVASAPSRFVDPFPFDEYDRGAERQASSVPRRFSTPPSVFGVGRGRAYPSLFSQEQSPSMNSVSPNVTVVVPPPKKVRRFSGAGGSLGVEDFIAEVQAELTDERDPVRFVLGHLDGAAKREIRTCGLSVKDVETIFSVLRAAFGDPRSLPAVLRAFMERVQSSHESVREYASDIYDLFTQVQQKQRELKRPVHDTSLLCDQFVDGLVDRDLAWELQGRAKGRSDVTFAELRQQAIDCERNKGPRRKKADVREVATEESEMMKLRAQVAELEKTLKDVVKPSPANTATGNAGGQPVGGRRAYPLRFKWTDDGKPICLRCKKAGHMVKECPESPPEKKNAQLNGNPSA